MASKRKPNKKPFSRHLKSYFKEFRFRTSDWLIITLAVLGFECLFVIWSNNIWRLLSNLSSFEELFYAPQIPALVIATFCTVFIYKAIKRRSISKYAVVIATILSIIGSLFLFGMTPSGQSCVGLFGVMTDCSDVYRFQIYILFLNPFSLIIESLLALTATIVLVMQSNKE